MDKFGSVFERTWEPGTDGLFCFQKLLHHTLIETVSTLIKDKERKSKFKFQNWKFCNWAGTRSLLSLPKRLCSSIFWTSSYQGKLVPDSKYPDTKITKLILISTASHPRTIPFSVQRSDWTNELTYHLSQCWRP